MKKLLHFSLLILTLGALQGCASMASDPETRAFFYEGWRNPKERDDPNRQYLTTQ